MNVDIRKCKQSDLKACAALFAQVFSEPPYNDKWTIEEAYAYLERFFRIDPKNCLVAVQDGNIEGALFGYCYPWQQKKDCCIQELFVRKENRRLGIAKSLVDHLIKQLGPGVAISLVANEKAVASTFYKKFGLSQHQFYKFYYGKIPAAAASGRASQMAEMKL